MQQKINSLGVDEFQTSDITNSKTPNNIENPSTNASQYNKVYQNQFVKIDTSNISKNNNSPNYISDEYLNITDKKNSNNDQENDINNNSQFHIGRWTEEEHRKFIDGILEYGNEWKKVQQIIKTRSSTQARSHAQKFFLRVKKVIKNNGGNFNIKTLDGANTKNFDKDNDSAKGIKSSTNEHENVENILIINGGNFILDTADDSIHSDFNLTITGGIFEINSGDDGVHADQYLILGKEKTDNSLLNITIKKSYEGMEGAYIYLYSGSYYIISSDDGINTAGDTTQNCQPNQGGPQNNNGMQPHRNLRGRNLQQNIPLCGSFHMYIFGGDIYVNAGADGLDSNGNIEISGGNLEI